MKAEHFVISLEAKPGLGEDSFVAVERNNDIVIGVFDGCGGIGSKRYRQMQDLSGAYIASRLAALITREWLTEQTPESDMGERFDLSRYCAYLLSDAQEFYQRYLSDGDSLISGSMVQRLPTTMCLARLSQPDAGYVSCQMLWAGDSRIYILTPDGLRLYTSDDLEMKQDPFDNLYRDSPLSNYLSLSRAFEIHERTVSMQTPCIVLAATDGCFGYLPTPMHFEHMLLSTLCSSGSLAQWQEALTRGLGMAKSDDSTLAAAVVGFNTYEHMRRAFIPRLETLERRYIAPLDADSGDMPTPLALRLWNDYRQGFLA